MFKSSRNDVSSFQQRQTCSLQISPGAIQRLSICTKDFLLRQTRRLHNRAVKRGGVPWVTFGFSWRLSLTRSNPSSTDFLACRQDFASFFLFFYRSTHAVHAVAQQAATKICTTPALHIASRLAPWTLFFFFHGITLSQPKLSPILCVLRLVLEFSLRGEGTG